jgi:hypothetical protein
MYSICIDIDKSLETFSQNCLSWGKEKITAPPFISIWNFVITSDFFPLKLARLIFKNKNNHILCW